MWSFATVVVSTILSLGVFLVTSRILGPEEFGAVALATAIVTILATLVPSAFGDALVQRAELSQAHLDTVFWLAGGVGVLAFGAVFLATPAIAAWSGVAPLAAILPVLALRLIFDALLTVPASLIARRMQFRMVALRTTLANGFGAVACLWLVLNGYAIWALVAAQLVNAAAAFAISAGAAGYRPRFAFDGTALRELSRFGVFSMGNRFLNEARVDQFLLGLVLGAPALGLYYFAQRLFTLLRDGSAGVFGPVTNVLIASLDGDLAKRRTAYLVASFASAALTLPIFGGMLVLAPVAVPLIFGPQWSSAIIAVQCFAMLGLGAGIGTIQASLIRHVGRPDWWFWYQALAQVSAVPVILFLAPMGLEAVMMGLVVRAIVFGPFALAKTGALLELRLRQYLFCLRGPLFGAGLMVLWIVTLGGVLSALGPGVLLATQIATGAVLYGAVLVILSQHQISDIRRRFHESGQKDRERTEAGTVT